MFTKKDPTKTEKNDKTSKTSTTQEHTHSFTSGTSTKTHTSTDHKPTDHSTPYNKTDKKAQKTRVTVKYDVGFNNTVFIRGKGANLNWDKGVPLKNTKADEWVWEIDQPFSQCEFKVLINDRQYENGENHHLSPGSTVVYTPRF